MSTDSTTMKRCTKCEREFPATQEYFTVDSRRKLGLRSCCRACKSEDSRQRRSKNLEQAREIERERMRAWRETNSEHERARNRARYAANPDRERNRQHAWRQANKDRVRKMGRENKKKWRSIYPERDRENYRRWKASNQEHRDEYMREYNRNYVSTPTGRAARDAGNHRRRVRETGNGGMFTASDLAAIRAAQTDKKGRLICWRCGKPITGNPHLDHWIPVAKGGSNSSGNLHYMHKACNLSKHAKHPYELGRLL